MELLRHPSPLPSLLLPSSLRPSSFPPLPLKTSRVCPGKEGRRCVHQPTQVMAKRAGSGITTGPGLSDPICKVGITPELWSGCNEMILVKA